MLNDGRNHNGSDWFWAALFVVGMVALTLLSSAVLGTYLG